jgi:hypothetical protein
LVAAIVAGVVGAKRLERFDLDALIQGATWEENKTNAESIASALLPALSR